MLKITNHTNDIFELRQYMVEKFYEFHHYYDEIPPKIPLHQHTFYEIYFFISGKASYHVEGKSYKLQPGDLLLTSDQDIHQAIISPDQPYERFVIWIDPVQFERLEDYGVNFASSFADAARKNDHLIRPDSRTFAKLLTLCHRISEHKHSDEFGSSALSYAALIEFLVYLNHAYFQTPSELGLDITENDHINQVLAYINDHLAEELTLETLSQTFFISQTHLCKKFKRFTGLTILQYITKKRLIVSRNMIRSGVPILSACYDCGFTDYSNYLKAFKREFGHNPSELQKES